MSEYLTFENTHVFFDGNVVLRNFLSDGKKMTMGFMSVGKYRWLAEEPERFLISSGDADFIYNDKTVKATAGSEIFVPKGTTFSVIVTAALDYRCYYA